jgi:nucleotide-binding universal stress UspA family protein
MRKEDKMLDHVLVPLDGSQLAEKALDYAARIVNPSGKITLLTVLDVPEYPVYGVYPVPVIVLEHEQEIEEQRMTTEAKAYLESIARTLADNMLQIEIKLQVGEPAGTIVDLAEELAVDTIVMATHGRSGFSRWLFGSVTNKVLSNAPCPVYVVPICKKRAHPADEDCEEVAGASA